MARVILAELTITPALAGITGVELLKEELKLSARQRQKVIRTRGFKVNGRAAHSHTKLKVGQVVQVSLPAEEQVKVEPKPLPLDIIYEDDHLLVVSKPAGTIVHHIKPNQKQPSLVEGAAYYFQEQGMVIIPRPVHRLDRGASGVVIFAKTAEIQAALTKAWSGITKIYWVKVHGRLDRMGEITEPIKGKPARTKYLPLEIGKIPPRLRCRSLPAEPIRSGFIWPESDIRLWVITVTEIVLLVGSAWPYTAGRLL